jgi:D-aminoacyl-tRNA deacylase
MRLVVQRVRQASVTIDGVTVGEIGVGALVLAGIAREDTPDIVARMAEKLIGLRYFEDPEGRTNLSIEEVRAELLVVSQFTLLADLRRGRRPGFTRAASPEAAMPLLDTLVGHLRTRGIEVATGRFGADMHVALVNDGPFTLVMDSDGDLAPGP